MFIVLFFYGDICTILVVCIMSWFALIIILLIEDCITLYVIYTYVYSSSIFVVAFKSTLLKVEGNGWAWYLSNKTCCVSHSGLLMHLWGANSICFWDSLFTLFLFFFCLDKWTECAFVDFCFLLLSYCYFFFQILILINRK